MIARDGSKIVGVALAYPTSPEDYFNCQALRDIPQVQVFLDKVYERRTEDLPQEKFIYISYCGVREEYRNKGIAVVRWRSFWWKKWNVKSAGAMFLWSVLVCIARGPWLNRASRSLRKWNTKTIKTKKGTRFWNIRNLIQAPSWCFSHSIDFLRSLTKCESVHKSFLY